ncbi:hypothetical protein ACHAW5_005046 [Stephanodiscus triporus]|uniref:Uncharacterized protein n=1 Tax=Stephanodiscus triporus TaxID=2934178 RepID=A0ABD3MK36_9STRA
MQLETIRGNHSPNSLDGGPPWKRENSYKAAGLSVLSQSASLRSSNSPRSASVGQRSLHRDRPGNSSNETKHQCDIRSGSRRAEVKQNPFEMALKIIEETQGKKLSREYSTGNAPSRTKSRNSSMAPRSARQRPDEKVLPAMSDANHQFHAKSSSGPALHDTPFDDRQPRAFATSNEYNNSLSNFAGPSSFNDISSAPSDCSGRESNVTSARSVPVDPYETPQSTVSPLTPPPMTPLPTLGPTTCSPYERDQEYELSLKNDIAAGNVDWGKYQAKGDDHFKDSRWNNQEQPQQHQNPQQRQRQNHLPPQQLVPASQQGGDNNLRWMNYTVGDGKREEQRSASLGRSGRKSKMFGGSKLGMNEQIKSRSVKKMPFTDHFGDFGYYTGCVNDNGRPDGKGSMKYENGVFYEGTWTDGCQDKQAASQYERIRGGFTGWSGKGQGATKSGGTLPWNTRKNDARDDRAKTFVRGMEWMDFNGDSGRYSGGVNKDELPHGTGIMKYDFGLIAQGHWVNGVLKEGPHDRMISAAASMAAGMSVGGCGRSIGPGMSVGPGAMGYASGTVSVLGGGGMSVAPGMVGSGMSGMSIGPGISVGPMSLGPQLPDQGHGFPMAPMPMMQPPYMQYGGNPIVAAQCNYSAHNLMNGMDGGGGSIYGSPAMGAPVLMQTTVQPHSQMPQKSDKPPISEIKIGK